MINWLKSVFCNVENANDSIAKIKKMTKKIEKAIHSEAAEVANEKYWVFHYGANDIHPRHLVYWICVNTDKEKERLSKNQELYKKLRNLLVVHKYPISGRDGVYIGFESQETVDREADGNWWQHWK